MATNISHSMKEESISSRCVKLGKINMCNKTVWFYVNPSFSNAEDDQKSDTNKKAGFVTPYTFLVEVDKDPTVVPYTLKTSGPFPIPCYRNKAKLQIGDIISIQPESIKVKSKAKAAPKAAPGAALGAAPAFASN